MIRFNRLLKTLTIILIVRILNLSEYYLFRRKCRYILCKTIFRSSFVLFFLIKKNEHHLSKFCSILSVKKFELHDMGFDNRIQDCSIQLPESTLIPI